MALGWASRQASKAPRPQSVTLCLASVSICLFLLEGSVMEAASAVSLVNPCTGA